MWFRRYSEKDVKALVGKLKEEYEGVVRAGREAFDDLKDENARLRARVALLESERAGVTDALVNAEKAGEKIKENMEAEAENKLKELILLAEQCRVLLARLNEKYPDEADVKDFNAFCDALYERLHLKREEESGFSMDEVLFPKYPLDLEKLCSELGLMGDRR